MFRCCSIVIYANRYLRKTPPPFDIFLLLQSFAILFHSFTDFYSEVLPFLEQLGAVSEQSGPDQRTEKSTSGFSLDQPRRPTPTLPPGLPIPPGFEAPAGESERPQAGSGQRPFTLPA